MKLSTINLNGTPQLTLIENGEHYALSINNEAFTSALFLLDKKEVATKIEKADKTPLSDNNFAYAPLLAPQKIIGVGLNYRKHAAETGAEPPASPIYFAKFSNSLAAHGEQLPLSNIPSLDYEGELGVVIGSHARNVDIKDALDYVLGYTICNDLSARQWQGRGPQWTLGKVFDSSMPIGPHLVSADAVGDPQSLVLTTKRNDEVVQQESTDDMIFSVAEIISDLSHHMTLAPGDIISTGTPSGVILGQEKEQRQWLGAGDHIAIEISGLGTLKNTII